METLLNHHFPRLPLDVEALRRTCEALPSWSHDYGQLGTSRSRVESAAVQSASESPGIEDEKCTVEYVDDTTARMSPLAQTRCGILTKSVCCDADYSGEFSHWNFSMHIKRNIDELIAKSHVKVGQWGGGWLYLSSHLQFIQVCAHPVL